MYRRLFGRLSAAYEELRSLCDRFAATTGRRPKVFLANLGTPAAFTARSTFALSFFHAGGFEVVDGDGFSDPQAAVARLFESNDQVLDAEEVYALAQGL